MHKSRDMTSDAAAQWITRISEDLIFDPVLAEFVIKMFKDYFKSDDLIDRFVLPPFKSCVGYLNPLKIMVRETDCLSYEDFVKGKRHTFRKVTEYFVEENEYGAVVLSYRIVS